MRSKFKRNLRDLSDHLVGTKSILTFLRVSEADYRGFIAPLFCMLVSSALGSASFYCIVPFLDLMVKEEVSSNNLIVASLDRLFPNTTITHLQYTFYSLILVVSLMLAKNMFGFLGMYLGRRFSMDCLENLRLKILKRHLRFGVPYFEKQGIGKIQHAITAYPARLSQNIGVVSELVFFILQAIFFLMILFYLSWKLTLLTLLVLPLGIPASSFIRRRAGIASNELHSIDVGISKVLQDIVSCMPLVKALNTQKEEADRFRTISRESLSKRKRVLAIVDSVAPISESVHLLALLIFCFCYIYFSAHGIINLSSTSLMVYIFTFKRTSDLLSGIYVMRSSFETMEPQLRACIYILEHDEDKFIIKSGPRKISTIKQSIEIRDLKFSYEAGAPILDGLSLEIGAGKTLALVGPSGAGKSTIVKLILRFHECPPNSIFVDGYDIREYDTHSLRDKISYVSQDIMIRNATLRENLFYGIPQELQTEEKLQNAIQEAQLAEMVSKLKNGVETQVGERGVCLSNGQRQRVSIARALIKDSPLLILDEATSSLDTKTEREIQKAVDKVIQSRTAIVIAHRLSTIRDAQKIAVILNGRVAETGTIQELLEKEGHFASFWKSQTLGSAA